MTRTAGAQIGCQRPSRFWGLGCPKIYHEVEDTLARPPPDSSRVVPCTLPPDGPDPCLRERHPSVWQYPRPSD
ncbi:hypothetical protein [Thiolapillus sp.]|uniref:hypothetical protein n=1 Tax=Thiolapillus sp. TaxID=2017437 RepID=UPI003AF9EC64